MRNQEIRCRRCGWRGGTEELEHVTLYEKHGDVSTDKCPNCGAIVHEGMRFYDLFEQVGKELQS